MKVAVIDGQGGGIDKSLIRCIKKRFGSNVQVIALGTNFGATSAMIKEGADKGASGENAIVVTSQNVDIILGPLGIIISNAMLGEITPAMAVAITSSEAKKILIPLNICNVSIIGTEEYKLSQLLDIAINTIEELLNAKIGKIE